VEPEDYDNSMTVRLLVVDPQPFFGQALRAALDDNDGLEVVGCTTDELDAERLTVELRPDVVLTEVELSSGSGFSLARRVGGRATTVVLTRHHEGEVLLDAVSAGAMGCVAHDVDLRALAALVHRAAQGRFVLDDGRLHDTLKRASAARRTEQLGGPPKLGALTAREREILQLLALGLDNHAIAERLHVSAHTARTHVGNILRKLGVHSRADAARLALQESQAERDTHVLRIRGPDLEPR
jgi:two-component system, NarL family, response regulator DevR